MTSGPYLIPYPPPYPSPPPLPYPLPVEAQPPPPPRPWSVYIAWMVILAAATITIVMNVPRQSELAEETGPSLELELSARYALGIKQIFAGTILESSANNEQLLGTVRADAETPEQRVCLLPVIAELAGDKRAVKEADKLLSCDLPGSFREDVEALKQLYSDPHATLPPEVGKRLTERYGFFGKMAATHGRGSSDPLRRQIEGAERRTVHAIFAVFVGGGLAFLGGIVVMILLIVSVANGRSPSRFRPADDPIADVLLEGFAIWMALFVILEALPRKLFANASPAWNLLLAVPFVGAIAWIWGRGVGWGRLTQAVGWRRGQGIVREMLTGLKFYLAGMPLLALGLIVTIILTRISNSKAEHPIEREVHGSAGVILLMAFLACIFAPITEETLFRGMLMGHMRRRHGWIVSALLSSLLFAAIHPQGWTVIPMLASVAMILAALREQRQSIIGSMTAHAVHNAWVCALLFTMVG